MPVPGYGAGDLSAAGNLAGYVDASLLGDHVWRSAPGPADPEGILSTVPAVVSALAGIFVGEWLRSRREPRDKLIGLFVWGNLLLAAGLALAGWMPLNKNLWTSTYVRVHHRVRAGGAGRRPTTSSTSRGADGWASAVRRLRQELHQPPLSAAV